MKNRSVAIYSAIIAIGLSIITILLFILTNR